jgi:hypothetical protein
MQNARQLEMGSRNRRSRKPSALDYQRLNKNSALFGTQKRRLLGLVDLQVIGGGDAPNKHRTQKHPIVR